jgi:hypothetical protein
MTAPFVKPNLNHYNTYFGKAQDGIFPQKPVDLETAVRYNEKQ